MAFSNGVICAIIFLLLFNNSREHLIGFSVLIAMFFAESLLNRQLENNKLSSKIIFAAISYIVFIAIGSLLIDVRSNGYFNLGRLIVWGMLPAIVIIVMPEKYNSITTNKKKHLNKIP